ncbi:MAG TPA: class I SAM-dependent methyltransferase [Dehalococcoidia bacterium]|nr:class I SAM-dependent methyltransferase [Dehalococcoidia bacterium]
MKRITIPRKSTDDLKETKSYKVLNARRGQRLGKIFVNLLRQAGFKKGRVLDLGTRSAEFPIQLALAFPEAEVVGLDLPEPLLDTARLSAEKVGVSDRLYFKNGDAQSLPFYTNSFNVVVSLNMLHTVDDPVAMLDEIERVLSPTGILILSDIKRSWLGLIIPVLRTAYTMAEFKELLQRSKLRPGKLSESIFWLGFSTA